MSEASETDLRFDVPLYTVAEAARALDVSPTTLSAWATGYLRHWPDRPAVTGAPVVTSLTPVGRGQAAIPFVGLAEGMVLAAVRAAGVPMQRVRPALAVLAAELGVDHALGSRRLLTDGAELLFDYADNAAGDEADSVRQLVVVRSGQRVFRDVIEQYLARIDYAPDGYARLVRLPGYATAEVVADPERAFGQPIFARGGSRVADVLGRFWAGDDLATLADEFGVPRAELEDVLRVASRRAA
ncbi:MAG: DUF433 domain-containing protein [Pseudonocardiaceae bacterium]